MTLPEFFCKYGSATGEKGLAHIELGCIAGKTAITRLRSKAPLLVQKALYPDNNLPNMAHIYLMSSAGGILQGDRIEIDIVAGSGTSSRITTQAATKIYKMDKGYAAQNIKISAADTSYLEFIPYQLIPFKSSRFFQQIDIHLGRNSTVVYSETVSAGRIASGENFDFDVCFLKMTTLDYKGKLLFMDAAKLEPEKDHMDQLFGHNTIWSTVYVITPCERHDAISKQINAAIKLRSMLAGCSILPHDCGLVIRMLDDSIDKIRYLTGLIAEITRCHALPIKARPHS